MTDWIALGLSALALLVSARAAQSASAASLAATKLQARTLALEEARELDRRAAATKAQVVAFLRRGERDTQLCLRNDGRATASNVQVLLDGKTLREHPLRVAVPQHPMSLAPSGEIGIPLSNAVGTPTHFRLRVTWDDLSTESGTWESDISIQ